MDVRKRTKVSTLSNEICTAGSAHNDGIQDKAYLRLMTEKGRTMALTGKITIAIADDCALQHKIWDILIGGITFLEIVCRACNGEDLIRQIENSAVLPDICILDLEMPVMNGICTARRLSKRYPTIRMFGHTSCEDDHLKKEMLNSNVISIFPKTENRTLLHAICQLRGYAAVPLFS